MARKCKSLTDKQLSDVVTMRDQGVSYPDISAYLEKKYKIKKSAELLRSCHERYKDEVPTNGEINVALLKDIARTRKTNSKITRHNKAILDHLNESQDILDQIQELVKSTVKVKLPKVPKPKRSKTKTGMTVEMLVSDVHVGKLTKDFNLEVCRRRVFQYTTAVLQEIERKQAHYNIDRIVVMFGGDEIENATMHGIESMRGCEFANPEQVRWCIDIFWQEVILLLATTGIQIDVVGICGNHDRTDEKKTYQYPGKNAYSWIIYHTLKMLCEQAKLDNVSWTIPEGPYAVINIYGNNILYEHGDFIKSIERKVVLNHLNSRAAQLGIPLHGIRMGHFHTYCSYDNGAAIINGSVCGNDSYSDILGFNSLPIQVASFYVDTKNRDSKFFFSYPVQLT